MDKVIKPDEMFNGIKEKKMDGAEADVDYDPMEDFYTCDHCGQSIYMGDLGQVFHHELPEHEPLTRD